MVSWRRALWLVLVGCGHDPEPITQLVLVADSDLPLESITFEVQGAGGFTRSATASRAGAGPSFVALVLDDGPSTELTITATGRQGDKAVLARTHVVGFVPDETRVVPLDLYASCVGMMCPGETCAAGQCTPRLLNEGELPRWRGEPASPFSERDAGADAGWLRQCGAPKPVDTSKDAMNCGACGVKCEGKERCQLGVCKKP